MKKIAIIGCGGAGKSTLARQLATILRLPVIHLDKEFWQPGWQMLPKEEEGKVLEKISRQTEWIIDGNYKNTMSARFNEADTIIFLDFSTLLCLRRVIRRFFTYRGRTRPDMTEGCPEKLDWSFIGWVLSYRHAYRPIVLDKLKQHTQNRKILVFKKPKQVSQFLIALTESGDYN